MKEEINKEFIFIYFRGGVSVSQNRIIDEWIKNPDNEELYYKWLDEYESLHPVYLAELSPAIDHFYDHTEKSHETGVTSP
ncbi:hypothetical protein [Runella sp.]|uniref:hypothetical protein n=1 Tax=Runella sp. TaxID=1960881 RepID=UPI003D13E1A2